VPVRADVSDILLRLLSGELAPRATFWLSAIVFHDWDDISPTGLSASASAAVLIIPAASWLPHARDAGLLTSASPISRDSLLKGASMTYSTANMYGALEQAKSFGFTCYTYISPHNAGFASATASRVILCHCRRHTAQALGETRPLRRLIRALASMLDSCRSSMRFLSCSKRTLYRFLSLHIAGALCS